MFATAVGFAAFAVSDIRPVREMGLWTACGLIVAWVRLLHAISGAAIAAALPEALRGVRARRRFGAFVDVLVPATRRYRWPLVAGALAS